MKKNRRTVSGGQGLSTIRLTLERCRQHLSSLSVDESLTREHEDVLALVDNALAILAGEGEELTVPARKTVPSTSADGVVSVDIEVTVIEAGGPPLRPAARLKLNGRVVRVLPDPKVACVLGKYLYTDLKGKLVLDTGG